VRTDSSRIPGSRPRRNHYFLIYVDSGVEPDLLLFFKLDLLLINCDAIRSCRKLLIAVLSVLSIPVIYTLTGAINAEPFQYVSTL